MDYGVSQRELISRSPEFAAEMRQLRDEVKLGEAWRAVMDGKGSKEHASLIITDLILETGYFGAAPEDVPDRVLQQQNGKRAVMTRIFYLADLTTSHITKLRRDALDELQKLEV